MVTVEELHGMKYADLRKLAKSFGVKANMKADKLIASLEKKLKQQSGGDASSGNEEAAPVLDSSTATDTEDEITFRCSPATKHDKPKGKKTTKKAKAKTTSPAVKKVATQVIRKSLVGKSPLGSRPGTPGLVRPGSAKSTPRSGILASANKVTPSQSVGRKVTPRSSATKKLTPLTAGRKVTPKGSASKKVTPKRSVEKKVATPKNRSLSKVTPSRGAEKKVTPRSSINKKVTPSRSAEKKVTPRSGSIKKVTGSGKKVTPVRSAAKKTTPRANSGKKPTAKNSAGKTKKSPANSGRKGTPTSTSRIPRMSSSPDVKNMLKSMDGSMSNEEMKASLMATLNKSTSEQLEQVATDPDKSSQIPRFVAFAMRKKAEATVGPDFAKIHQRKFNKMEGIDSYLNKKRQRTDSLTTSVKKARLIAEKTRAAINSLNQCKTPPVVNGEKDKAGFRSRAALFKSPHMGVPFVPKVTSTTKMNTNFTAAETTTKKTPASSSSRKVVSRTSAVTPSASKENVARKSVGAARKSIGASRKSGASDNLNASTVTPFKFNSSMNTSSLNMSLNSAKKFDLKASLSKPLSWKPHTGKLRPFSYTSTVGAAGTNRADPKEFKAKTKEQYRKEAQRHRAAGRHDSRMKRRGVVA